MLCSADRVDAPSLRDVTSKPDYFARVSEVVQRIPAARDEAEAVELLQQACVRMGAEVAAFVSFIRDDESHESYRFLLACDPLWCFEYENQAWYGNDPWLAYALSHSEPICSSQIALATEGQRAVIGLAERYGFRSAVIVPAPSAAGLSRLGVLGLGSSRPGFFEADGFTALKVVARSAAMELHEWWVAKIKRELIASARITEEDLVLLSRERQGHSTKKIANDLQTTTSAIDCKFQRLNAKLGLPNRRAAARFAAEYGLI